MAQRFSQQIRDYRNWQWNVVVFFFNMIGTRHLTAHIIIYVMFSKSSTHSPVALAAISATNTQQLDLTAWRQISFTLFFFLACMHTEEHTEHTGPIPPHFEREWKWNKWEICSIDFVKRNFCGFSIERHRTRFGIHSIRHSARYRYACERHQNNEGCMSDWSNVTHFTINLNKCAK